MAAPASAAVVDFETNSSTLSATGGSLTKQISSDLFVTAYAWNANAATGGFKLTTARLGDYLGGLGVTSTYDNLDRSNCSTGACGTHQVDNAGNSINSKSYDFVQLVFTDAKGNAKNVTIDSLSTTSWGTYNAAQTKLVYDNDFSIGAGSAVSNNATVANLTSLFSKTYGDNGACDASYTSGGTHCEDTTAISGIAASSSWYIAASIAPGGYGGDGIVDGIKIAGITVSVPAAVPEPASWSMMILGFGVTGTAMRRRKTKTAIAAA